MAWATVDSDAFPYADGLLSSVGTAKWSTPFSDLRVVSNVLYEDATYPSEAVFLTQSSADNTRVTVDVAAWASGTFEIKVCGNASSPSPTECFDVYLYGSGGTASVEVWDRNAGGDTQLGATATLGSMPTNTTMQVEVTWSAGTATIIVRLGGTQVASRTSTRAYTGSGHRYSGLRFTNSVARAVGLDNWLLEADSGSAALATPGPIVSRAAVVRAARW